MGEIRLQDIYKVRKNDRDIFQDLMHFKVKEILLVANFYDSYTVVREGQFFDQIFGEYLQLNLYSAPRITSVTCEEEALEKLNETQFDMVILMAGLDKERPQELAKSIKQFDENMPLLLLVNNNAELTAYQDSCCEADSLIDRIFVWNGESRVFVAMIKYIEDKMNVEADTALGDVRIILLVEDSIRYYTRYLPLLYKSVMMQTQAIINENAVDELHTILKMRVRPKILLCSNFEEAAEVVDKYYNNLLTVISDVSFKKDGVIDHTAGMQLIDYVRSRVQIPCLIQSADLQNKKKATELGAQFIYKESDLLVHELEEYLLNFCGFGDFVFKNSHGKEIDRAHNLIEFEAKLLQVPLESVLYHARRQGISIWLMARGEIVLAKKIRGYMVDDFESSIQLREHILHTFERVRMHRLRGRILAFDKRLLKRNEFVMRLGKGALGGKGRGLAFLSHFVANVDFSQILPGINIHIPASCIVASDEFDLFMESNGLLDAIAAKIDYQTLQKRFVQSSLSSELREKLRELLSELKNPLAVRSSGLFEDSMLQPFAGVYATYMLPNNHADINIRLNQLEEAIKLIYASIYSPTARNYFSAVNYKIDEEKMAIIIQEVVGEEYHHRFYPRISGVAQSYNYYPFSYMKPEDGFSVLAVGLGRYVVDGEKSHRFCPKYPHLELKSLKDQVKDSQTYFYAIDLSDSGCSLLDKGEDCGIVKLQLKEAEEDGNLQYCAQVYDYEYDRLETDFIHRGSRVVNFADILQYDHIPLAPAIEKVLQFFQEALGSPVEIEFAVDLRPDKRGRVTLFLLQIKPLIRLDADVKVDLDSFEKDDILFYGHKGMGNGIVEEVYDVVYMDVAKFDKMHTDKMAKEIGEINRQLKAENRTYVLIGPGRWGTRDRFTGIPVVWSQISNAKVIIEMGLKNFPLDASMGSHFFHNVTSMNVGYFSVPYQSEGNIINLSLLEKQVLVSESNYFKHVRFPKPIHIQMDGKKQEAVVAQNTTD